MNGIAAPGVAVHDLSVRLGRDLVLRGLDLDIPAGELLVLLGPSGCGKSTLLQGISGLVNVERGSVHIGDRDVTFDDPKDRGIGMVFQSYALYPTMNVEGNLSFGLRAARLSKPEIARRVQRVACMLQLDELLRRKPSELSGGQRQRVAIGRALVRDARLFLFDEPLSNLDAALRTELRREIKRLHADLGVTTIYVTHDQVEAMALASRIAVMRHGRILQVGTPHEIYTKPVDMFVAGFLGSPGMNFLRGRLDADPGGVRFVAGGLSIALPRSVFVGLPIGTDRIVFGVRPEHIALYPSADSTAQVTLIESLGSHALVWLDFDGQRLAAMVNAGDEPPVGERVCALIDGERCCLFDPASQQRL